IHISRTFKQHVGLAPHEYLVQLRVACAKAKLAEGMPIADAAIYSGFTDQSHLNRHFKRITHLTPGEYAKSCYKHSRRS
ncbi:MAG: helix-turn-helix domain-containing protein, partial [Acidobacteria bacterium]|nr:helix-turn-helix domain-containing protein [Acidobacteriota bacterium]MCA1639721.1 helix-turn-helix domain-containing protein [Acidobacteriota bacterium]